MNKHLLHFNGVNGATGQLLRQPMSVRRFTDLISGRVVQPLLRDKGVTEGIDASNPAEAGWGIVVPQDLDPAIRAALEKLAQHRANPHFDWFTYLPGETVPAFLSRHGAGPGPVVPKKLPYYLLLIGSPTQIPFRFQESLDVQHAVGRLDLGDAEDYEIYVQSLIDAEAEGVRHQRAVFFGVQNPDDPATANSAKCLVQPLAEACAEVLPSWQVVHHAEATASKATLHEELHGKTQPALIFTAGHAISYPAELEELQRRRQGALLMSDWPGPKEWDEPVPREQYFAAHDLTAEAQVHGLVAFHFACFSGGTPRYDSFVRNGQAPEIASAPFVARLPQALLSHRRGGALAVIAHVDRAWETSFLGPKATAQVAVFESALRRILEGHPIGYAMEAFGQRYAELAVQLHDQRHELDIAATDAAELLAARLWTAYHDARGYVLLGDPATRLSIES